MTFTGMGKDIIYLPAYYKGSRLIPAGEPFLLDSTGNVSALCGNGKKLPVTIHQVGGSASYNNNLKNIRLLDGLKIIGYSKDNKTPDTFLRKVCFHFKKDANIASVRIAPYIQNIVENDGPFTLYFWDKGWKEAGTQQTTKSFLTFENAPDNRLYMLRHQRWAKKGNHTSERFFLYKEGEVLWY